MTVFFLTERFILSSCICISIYIIFFSSPQGVFHFGHTLDISLNILILCHNGDDLKDDGPRRMSKLFVVFQRIA